MDKKDNHEIKVCNGFHCSKREADKVKNVLIKHFDKEEIEDCCCLGNCHYGNNIVVNGEILENQSSQKVVSAVKSRLRKQRLSKIKEKNKEFIQILGL